MAQTKDFEADGGTVLVRFLYRRTLNKVKTLYDGVASRQQKSETSAPTRSSSVTGAAFKRLEAPQSFDALDTKISQGQADTCVDSQTGAQAALCYARINGVWHRVQQGDIPVEETDMRETLHRKMPD